MTKIRPFSMLLLLFAGIMCDNLPAQEAGIPYDNSRYITIDSVRIHYRTWNSHLAHPRGKVVLVHGFSGSTFCFRNQYDTLAKLGYFVVAPDLPAFGYSDRGTWINHSQSNRALLVWKLLDSISQGDTTRWNILGHSMGGGTAEAMALLHPEKTRCLLFVAGMFFNHNNNMMSLLGTVLKQKYVRGMLIDYVENRMITEKRFGRMLKNAYRRHPDSTEVQGYLRPLRLPGTPEAIVSTITNTREVVKLDADGLKTMRFIAVWGTRDSWIPYRTTTFIKNTIPNVKLITIEGAGHMPMETHVARFNVIMLEAFEQK